MDLILIFYKYASSTTYWGFEPPAGMDGAKRLKIWKQAENQTKARKNRAKINCSSISLIAHPSISNLYRDVEFVLIKLLLKLGLRALISPALVLTIG